MRTLKNVVLILIMIVSLIDLRAQNCMGTGSGWNSLAGNNAVCGKFFSRALTQSKIASPLLIHVDTNRIWSNDTSALLELRSTTKGVLIPAMTASQMNAIVSPANGLQVYNTSVNALHWYNGSSWNIIGGGGSSYTFNNGLTETAGTAKWGGNITAPTAINLSTQALRLYGKYANLRMGNDTLFGNNIATVGFYKPLTATLNGVIGMRNTSAFGQDSVSMTFGYEDLTGARSARLYIQPITGDVKIDATRDVSVRADRNLNLQGASQSQLICPNIASVFGQTGTFEAGFFKFWETLTPNIVVSNIYTGKLGNGGLITDWNSWYCKTDTSTGVTRSGMYQLTTPATDSSTSNRHVIEIEKDSFVIAFNANSSSNGGLRQVIKSTGWSFNRDSADVVKISPTGLTTTQALTVVGATINAAGLGVYADDSAAAGGGVPIGGLYVESVTGYIKRRLV